MLKKTVQQGRSE